MEILALKVNYTKNLTGVVYAKTEARSKIFADDFSAMVLRTEENLRNFSRILTLFHSVSGLKCNLDKTFVIPVGNFAKGTMCKDLNLKWTPSQSLASLLITGSKICRKISTEYTTRWTRKLAFGYAMA